MKLKSLLINLTLLGVLSFTMSCSKRTKENSDATTNKESKVELQKKIDLDSIRLIGLSNKAQDAIDDWMMYIALTSEIERLENYTLQDVVNNSATIHNVVDSLTKTVPKVFDTNAIKARIITLKTHSNLLEENSKRAEPKAAEIKELSAKLKLDFNNLNIQLNEVFIIKESTEDPIETEEQ